MNPFIEAIKQYFDTVGVNLVKYCKFAAVYRNLKPEETRNTVSFEGMSNDTIQKEYEKEMKELFKFLKDSGYKFDVLNNNVYSIKHPDAGFANLFETVGTEDVIRVWNEDNNVIFIYTKSTNKDNAMLIKPADEVLGEVYAIYVPSIKVL